MKLKELFDSLSCGELNQLAIGNSGNGIRPEDYPKVITQLKAGLTALHARFPLREREVIIQQYGHISVYFLRPEFAVSNTTSTEPTKYIIDTPTYPFTGRVLKVMGAYNEGGCPIPINDDPLCCSVFTPTFDSVQVVSPMDANALFLTYRADHEEIIGDLDEEIRIPASHVKALSYYIAAQFYSAIPSLDATNKGMEWQTRYENECIRIEQYDLNNQALQVTNTKPERRGWV
ncbi:MAG: hypothetical protein ACRDCE_11305 [Cetobacterium sp.]|uniref:hypothetical protein n=1 Tax=Cetobacterium sp. TaxID=2071632 RepID=UPI003EE68E60